MTIKENRRMYVCIISLIYIVVTWWWFKKGKTCSLIAINTESLFYLWSNMCCTPCNHRGMSHVNINISLLSFIYTSLAETTQQVAPLQQSCGMAFDCKNSLLLSSLLNMHHWQFLNSYFVHKFCKWLIKTGINATAVHLQQMMNCQKQLEVIQKCLQCLN